MLEDRTPEQIRDEQHLGFVVMLLGRGYGMRTIADLCRVQYGFGATRAQNLLRKAREALRGEADERRPYARAEQIARVRARIAELLEPRYGKQVKNAKGEPVFDSDGMPMREKLAPNGAQLARFEELLADLEGNREPTKVAVAVTMVDAFARVLANRTEKEIAILAARARERQRLALVAKNGEIVESKEQVA